MRKLVNTLWGTIPVCAPPYLFGGRDKMESHDVSQFLKDVLNIQVLLPLDFLKEQKCLLPLGEGHADLQRGNGTRRCINCLVIIWHCLYIFLQSCNSITNAGTHDPIYIYIFFTFASSSELLFMNPLIMMIQFLFMHASKKLCSSCNCFLLTNVF